MQMPFSICNNMQKNMQTLNPICKILQGLYSAYSAYICTAQFADDHMYVLVRTCTYCVSICMYMLVYVYIRHSSAVNVSQMK